MNALEVDTRLVAIQPNGDRYYIDEGLETLTFEEYSDQLSMRLVATIANAKVEGPKKRVAQVLANGTVLHLDYGDDKPHEFRIFRNRTSWDGGRSRHEIVAYDPLFYLLGSEDDRFYKAGLTATEIHRDLCRAYGVPFSGKGGPTEKLSKKAFKAKRIADMSGAVLAETRRKDGGRWLLQHEAGQAVLNKRGGNARIYYLEQDTVSNLSIDRSVEDIVTVAKIVGRSKAGTKVLATARSEFEDDYGTLQRIVDRSAYDKPSGAEKAARKMIESEGEEQKLRTLLAPDVVDMRRGHKVHITAGTMDGFYIVKDISHDRLSKSMALTVDARDREDVDYTWTETGLDQWIPPEDYERSSPEFKGDPSKALGIAAGVARGPQQVYDFVARCAAKAGGGFIITSWNRPGARTSSGSRSCHDGGHAVDIKGGDLARLAAELRKAGAQEIIYPDPDSDGVGIHLHVAPFCG